MDNLVKRMVDMDKELRNYVQKEQARLQELKDSVQQEDKKVKEEYHEKANKRISVIRQQNEEFIQGKYSQTEERYLNAKKQLESAYEENKERWVSEIVSRCLNI